MMKTRQFTNLPSHIGIIPDGNRRWAEARGLPRHAGYDYGLAPALEFVAACTELGVRELTFYGFTQDNTKRAAVQREAFQRACVEAVRLLAERDAAVLVVGNTHSPMFPSELLPYTKTVGDCPNFSEASRKNGTAPFSADSSTGPRR